MTGTGRTLVGDQTKGYDKLNRLASATEKYNNNTSWARTFNYDQFGNRWVTNPQSIGLTGATQQSLDNYKSGTSPQAVATTRQAIRLRTCGNVSIYDAENRLTNFDKGVAI